jgi:hypothetical protein
MSGNTLHFTGAMIGFNASTFNSIKRYERRECECECECEEWDFV